MLLSTFCVTDPGDSGPGTLRDAITRADADTTPDVIDFNLGGGGHQVIMLQSALPTLTNTVTIDGTSQPEYAGMPLVELNGDGFELRVLDLEAASCVVRGLVINNITGGGDSGVGIFIGPTAVDFVVQNTYIGTDATGSVAVPVGSGVECYASRGVVGGTSPGQGDLISGCTGYGLQVQDIFHVTIQGNFVGTNAAGNAAIRNHVGIQVGGENGGVGGLVIGGTMQGARNVISGNDVGIGGFFGPEAVVIQGNYIGTDVSGTSPVPNAFGINGISSRAVIGGTDPGSGNLISGNEAGIGFVGDSTIQGNLIGTDITGMVALPNTRGIEWVSNCLIGGTTAAARNVVSGNSDFGIGAGLVGNTIEGNYLGTDITGEVGLGGSYLGAIYAPVNCTVVANVISSGNSVGVFKPQNCTFKGNLIGTNKEGTGRVGNYIAFEMDDGASTGNVIGGTSPGDGNVISGNSVGIWLRGVNPNADTIQNDLIEGNLIGTDIHGTAHLGNAYGLYVDWGVSGITVGGTAAGSGNVIAYNDLGAWIINTANAVDPTGVSVLGNAIYGNDIMGIGLSTYTANNQYATIPNDPLDADTGPNGLQNYPTLSAAYAGSRSIVVGSVNSSPNDTFRVEFFANPAPDPSGYGQGQRYLGFISVTTNASGNASFVATGLAATSPGESISATATYTTCDANGNVTYLDTSEFSQDMQAVPLPPSSLSGVVFSDFNDDGQVDFGEQGIPSVPITLTGTDFLGNPVSLSQTTDADGTYVFQGLLPGTYTITETQQPAGYTPGIYTVGTGGGTVSGAQFTVALMAGQDAMNYNYGEQPAATGSIKKGQTAGIGFWNNKNGQALIKALNNGVGTQLGDWLAATFPHMFGSLAGASNLAGKSNAFIAALFQSDFVVHGQKLDAQVLATALAVYVTDPTLDSTSVGTQYGFLVSGNGVATSTVNIGSNGAAFGVANNTVMTVLDILLAADAQAVNGVLYNGDATKRNAANTIFSAINEAGGL